jgi:uncharacterized damage-inducible protein DinB
MFEFITSKCTGRNMALVYTIVEYMMWANDTVWKIVQNLTEEEYNRVLGEGAGSIHRRYIHLAEDTWEWFHEWLGEEPEEPDFLGMIRDELYHFIMEYILKWKILIDERKMEHFNKEHNGKIVTIDLDEMIFHLVNHYTYHRGQIVMGPRILVENVQMTDYVPYRLNTS